MNPVEEYKQARNIQVVKNIKDNQLNKTYHQFLQQIHRTNYVKNFTWMGRPILQFPSDLMVLQEIIFKVKPTLIIECGVAFGGLTVFLSSILEYAGIPGIVLGIDIEIREHNRKGIHDIDNDNRIILYEGSSVESGTMEYIDWSLDYKNGPGTIGPRKIMVCLDSNHTHDHVLKEMELYGPLVSVGSYMVVFDTAIAYVMSEQPADRPWGPGNNPLTAVQEFLKTHDEFVVDREVEQRALLTCAPGGWLRKIK